MPDRSMPARCPSCSGVLVVTRLVCPDCGSEVAGEFDPCPACRLPGERRIVFDAFLGARGNLREVQRELGVSYPTARLRVEDMFRALGSSRPGIPGRSGAMNVLERLKAGEIGLDEAEKLIGGGG